jgi:hypothetical protein
MLTLSYLFNRSGTDTLLGGGGLKFLPDSMQMLRLVVPREACIYARVNCQGIPYFGLRSFAKLQAEQLSPFQQFGAFATKQGTVLHVWLWDKAVEISFQEKHGGRSAKTVLPQSIFTEPREHGVGWLRDPSQPGVEAQLWRNRALVDSLYFESPPNAQGWNTMAAQHPDLVALGWPSTLPLGSDTRNQALIAQTWGRNLLSTPLRLPKINTPAIASLALWLATAALTAFSAALWTERAAHQKVIADGIESQKQRIEAFEPIQQARDKAQNVERWLASVQALSPRPSKVDILHDVADLLTRQGLMLRDFELAPPTISAVLVPYAGADVRLTSVIGAIEAHPRFYDARFVDVAGGNGFKFTWRLRSDGSVTGTQGERP